MCLAVSAEAIMRVFCWLFSLHSLPRQVQLVHSVIQSTKTATVQSNAGLAQSKLTKINELVTPHRIVESDGGYLLYVSARS